MKITARLIKAGKSPLSLVIIPPGALKNAVTSPARYVKFKQKKIGKVISCRYDEKNECVLITAEIKDKKVIESLKKRRSHESRSEFGVQKNKES